MTAVDTGVAGATTIVTTINFSGPLVGHRAAPKAPLFTGVRFVSEAAPFFVAGPPQTKRPLGGQQAEGAAWGHFLLPGRPKTKKPRGAASRKAQRGGHFLLPGRPKANGHPTICGRPSKRGFGL